MGFACQGFASGSHSVGCACHFSFTTVAGVGQVNKRRNQQVFPRHINSVQWEQATGYARTACARIFRDGGSPAIALEAFGLDAAGHADWSTAVDRIALSLCAPLLRKAA
jgi:hypothetical protein